MKGGRILKVSQVLKEIRQKHGLTQDSLAQKLHVSRSAVARWESADLPNIANLLAISETFQISLDRLIKEDKVVKEKIIRDSRRKKWHYGILAYLLVTLIYIAYFALVHRIFMLGFLVATIFALAYESKLFLQEKKIQKNWKWMDLLVWKAHLFKVTAVFVVIDEAGGL